MDKQTKLLLGVGLVGFGAYMLWKSQQPKTPKGFAGADWNDVVGKRKGFVNELPAQDSKFNFNALAEAPTPTLQGTGKFQYFEKNKIAAVTPYPRFSGFVNELPAMDSGWVRADGMQLAGLKVQGKTTDNTTGKFYDVAEPRWSKYTGAEFFDVKDKGWDGK